ncbi:hypothetical protein GF377_02385 [candidate division GN15 bacterium]|nr:hypothetical protein [candidate division GN15 bacterium]
MATCSNFLLHCMDFRIQQTVDDYLQQHGFMGDCDRVAYGGPCQEHELALHYIDLSIKIHDTKHIILSQHEDCGGYGGTAKWGSVEKEREVLLRDMRSLRKKVLVKHPSARVSMVFVERDGDNWRAVEIQPDE